jgi:hypothetical protein
VTYKEWLAARKAAFRKGCLAYWLGCCEYVAARIELNDEQRAVSTAAIEVMRRFVTDPSRENRAALIATRRSLSKAQRTMSTIERPNKRPLTYGNYWWGLRYAALLMMGDCAQVRTWDLCALALHFDDNSNGWDDDFHRLYKDARRFIDDIKTAFTDYNNDPRMFRESWQKYKASLKEAKAA